MAVKVTYDTVNKLIICNAGVTTLDVRVDLYSDAKEDWENGDLDINTGRLNKFSFPFRVIGGDDTAPGEIAPLYAYLKYGWRVRPDEADHVLNIINGALLVDGDTTLDPITDTVGAYNVRIRFYVPIKGTLMTTGSGVTAQDKIDIVDGVWDEDNSDHLSVGSTGAKLDSTSELTAPEVGDAVWEADLTSYSTPGTFGFDFRTMLGLQQHNFRLKDQQYTQVDLGNNNFKYVLTDGTIRVYNNATDAGNDASHFAEYTISATYDSNGNCTAYSSVLV